VQPGEFLVILGRSGSGKTTFLRALNRLVEPTAGRVSVAGRAVTGAGPAELRAARRRIGVIFQQFNLVRRASVLDNVLAGRLGCVPPLPSLAGPLPAARPRARPRVPGQVGLATWPAPARRHALGRRAAARGDRARARAGARGDPGRRAHREPRSALTTEIMGILKSINAERGLTLVVSQHQLETALAYATRIVGLRPAASASTARRRGDARDREASTEDEP
jgi:phosphonate transport system ATP-binding protein